MSVFDKIDLCVCGYKLKSSESICPKCGRAKYKMTPLPKEDVVVREKTIKTIAEAKEFTKKIGAFQLARDKGTK